MRMVILISVLFLTSCAGLTLENSIGVDPDDNAVLCATADIDPTWTESRIEYKRIELPKDFKVTPEQLAELVRACQGN